MIDTIVNKKEEGGQDASQIRHGDPPYYAYFERPDGSWYMLWMTHTQPKTRRGHPWHVHATYDKHGATKPNLSSPWFEQPYGMRNWAFDRLEDAVEHFYHERYLMRLARAYKLVVGNIPADWPVH